MLVGVQSFEIIISQTATLIKCSRVAFINVYRKGIPKQKTRSQHQACSRHKLLKVITERIEKVVQSNRRPTLLQIAVNLNQRTTTNISERFVRRILYRIGYGS
ncbi:hypothetical protein TNCV_3290421 [Trichonephila clavipes]|nr:hypothetical protein TNCV_3290421 [Trichonephila clavipes]